MSPNDSVRNIGVIFDSNMSMKDQVSNMCRNAWFHLRQIGLIRSYLDDASAAKIIHSFVSSRLDTFNALLFNMPSNQVKRLQRIQNAAARLITRTSKRDSITPVLKALHWLPIYYRIQYKILVITFKALHDMAPQYISELLNHSQHEMSLRSNSKNLLVIPFHSHATTGDRSFSFAAPSLWNNLPQECRDATTLANFKSLLKTHLFKCAYEC